MVARERSNRSCGRRNRTIPARGTKRSSSYVEDLNEARARLAELFSILLDLTCPEAFREQLQRARRSHRVHPLLLGACFIRRAVVD